MRRTQIYLDDEQASRLDRRAAAQGTTRSKVIRLAIDDYLTRTDRDLSSWRDQWQEALDVTAGAAPNLPDGADYVDDIRRSDAGRLTELSS
jgi:predicted transcriptional regulator